MQLLGLMNKFLLKDKEKFDEAYRSLEFPLAEHSFAWIYLWRETYRDIEWTKINGNLCMFLTFEGNRCVWGPVLPGNKLGDTIKKCLSLCENHNASKGLSGTPKVMYIPEELREEYGQIEGFRVEEQDSDYIYLVEDIAALRGKKLKDKRNKRNYFVKNFRHDVQKYDEKRRQGCLDLLERWKIQKQEKVQGDDLEKLNEEVSANMHALDEAKELGAKGIVVLVDGRIEGYIFGERTNEKICTLFFGKTNLEIKGLSQFIYSEFMKEFEGCKFVNDGEGWGVDYLDHSKQSYNPAETRTSYMLVPNGQV